MATALRPSGPRTHAEYHVLDACALSNEVLGQLHQLGYAADARLIVFVRYVQARGDGGQAPEETEQHAQPAPDGPTAERT